MGIERPFLKLTADLTLKRTCTFTFSIIDNNWRPTPPETNGNKFTTIIRTRLQDREDTRASSVSSSRALYRWVSFQRHQQVFSIVFFFLLLLFFWPFTNVPVKYQTRDTQVKYLNVFSFFLRIFFYWSIRKIANLHYEMCFTA